MSSCRVSIVSCRSRTAASATPGSIWATSGEAANLIPAISVSTASICTRRFSISTSRSRVATAASPAVNGLGCGNPLSRISAMLVSSISICSRRKEIALSWSLICASRFAMSLLA